MEHSNIIGENIMNNRNQNIINDSLFSKILISKKVMLPITNVGKNIKETLEKYLSHNFEGKCQREGYIKKQSISNIIYSSGIICQGNNIVFNVSFTCLVCFPVEGMKINGIVENITKAGIRASSYDHNPSPIVIFISKDHHYKDDDFMKINNGDQIVIRVIGQRFELNDKYISIIGELVQD